MSVMVFVVETIKTFCDGLCFFFSRDLLELLLYILEYKQTVASSNWLPWYG